MANLGDSLFNMVGSARDVAPNRDKALLQRAINRRIKAVVNRRAWSDLIQLVTVNYAAPYNTGLVNLSTGSNIVIGTGPDANGNYASWPVADYINTAALPQVKVAQPGYNRIQPASMKGIKPGQWLLIDNGAGNPAQQGPNPEAVAVVWSDPTTFLAEFSYPHNPGFTIEASSFAGLQIQVSYPLATIQAVPNATTLWVDQTTGGPSLSGTTYTILTAYIQPDPYCWRVKFGVDPTQGIPLDCENNTYEDILIGDPQLTNSANPAVIVPTPFLGGGGVAQWMTYPLIFSEYYLNLIIVKTWPKLIQDSDRSPNFLDSEMFIAGAKADSLRTNLISRPGEKDPFFNLQLADRYEALFEKYLSDAEERDESLSHHRLQSYARTVAGAFSAVYWQSHPGWPTDFGSWSQ